jgi:hypothetical protein
MGSCDPVKGNPIDIAWSVTFILLHSFCYFYLEAYLFDTIFFKKHNTKTRLFLEIDTHTIRKGRLLEIVSSKLPDTYDIARRKCLIFTNGFRLSYLIFSFNKWIAPFGAKTFLLLINPCRLAPKYFEYFTGSAPPLFILDPLSGLDQPTFLCI